MAIKGKKKGNAYELKIRKEMIDLGFDNCKTSRYANRMMDDLKVDLVGTEPFYIQCKATEKAPNFHDVLNSMPDLEGIYNLVFHKRNKQGDVVVMKKEVFYELVQMLKTEKIL